MHSESRAKGEGKERERSGKGERKGSERLSPSTALYIPFLMCVALTSVHPTSGLYPLHPGCTSGYGDWWAGMLAGACSGLYAYFFAPPAPQNAWGRPKPPPGCSYQVNCSRPEIAIDALDGALDRQLRDCIRPGLAFKIHFGAPLMELLLVSLSSQCHIGF
jgi:hypothetical protein